jgi:hypothetical protein
MFIKNNKLGRELQILSWDEFLNSAN